MGKSARFIGLALTLIVPMAGCASSMSGKQTGQEVGKSETNPPVQTKATPPSVQHVSDIEATQQVMAELQQIGATDPVAQHKLMANLQQADPSIWPLVMQQFRAGRAYRGQTGQPAAVIFPAPRTEGSPYHAVETPPQMLSSQMLSSRSCAQRPSFDSCMPAPLNSAAPGAAPGQYPLGIAPVNLFPWEHQLGASSLGESKPRELEQPPSADTSKLKPGPDPQPSPAKCPSKQPAASPLSGKVASASFEKKVDPDDVQQHLDAAASAMESGISETPQSPEDIARHVRLRMLYLVAGRQEAALQPIPTVAPAVQAGWTKQLSGLSAWLDTQQTPDPTERVVAAKRVLDESMVAPVEATPLEIQNLTFCTEIQSYGCTKPFEKYEFEPGQEVLLYTEIENFTSEQTPKGYHTALRSSYQIFDSKKQRVADRDCPKTEEYCKNPRRDFFIGYHLVLPEDIGPGKHTLQLTIEDLQSRKIGQASIDLTIKEAAKDSPAKNGKLARK